MDAIETLKQDVLEGRISAAKLIDVLADLQKQVQSVVKQLEATQHQLEATQHQLETANRRVEELEKQLGRTPTAKLDEPFSMRAEEKRQEERGKKRKKKTTRNGRKGRISSEEKIAKAERREPVYPEGVDQQQCQLSHVRPVWRLENGRAVLVAYEVYRGPNNRYGQIPGALGRSEFGLEIVTEIAYLVYVIGISFDKVCALLQFFQNLDLKKGQLDALLKRLAKSWEKEFDHLCALLANSLVVHADETSWSLKSVWALLSEKARIVLFGVNKDAETLKAFLDPQTFAGLIISDDAAVYAMFNRAQKCWAHLLRKAIKLTLADPDNKKYRDFLDCLLEIYHDACRVQADGRLVDAGRTRKISDLEQRIFALCQKDWDLNLPPQKGLANDYRLLVNELMRLTLEEQLFQFVAAAPVSQPNGETKPVSGTNNEAERTLRSPASARDTGRTDKAFSGARRRTIITSVLESLRLHLTSYTLTSVLEELKRWWQSGQSCFARLMKKLKLKPPEQSILNRVLPSPSG
jgi:transposase